MNAESVPGPCGATKRFHLKTVSFLEAALRAAAPSGLSVAREMSVVTT
jgi:hypothetical protein